MTDHEMEDVGRIYQNISENVDEDIRKRKRELKEEKLGKTEDSENEIRKKLDDAIDTDEKHDELISAVATAFNPRSHIAQETGWRIRGTEPLYEVNSTIRNPDVLIGHDERPMIIAVECKSGIENPRNALTQLREASENLLEYSDYLENKIDISFTEVEMVLLVPGSKSRKAKDAIEDEEEEEGDIDPIYLWKFYTFDDERLIIHQDFNTRSENDSVHNNRLANYLTRDGVKIGEDPLSGGDFFPESNLYTILSEVFFEVIDNRNNSDNSVKKFTDEEIKDVIDDQSVMLHYATEVVADHLTSILIDKLLEYNLIIPKDPTEEGFSDDVGLYSYNTTYITGQKTSTILSNLQESYMEKWCEEKAEKAAKQGVVQDFLDGQSSLDFFDGSDSGM